MAKQQQTDLKKSEKKYREVYLYDQKTGIYLGPCDASENDPEGNFTETKPPHVGEMDKMVMFRNGEWVVIPSASLSQISDAIDKRNRLLASSDFSQLADTQVDKKAWADYRQELRDVPAQKEFPAKIEWPKTPSYEIVKAEK